MTSLRRTVHIAIVSSAITAVGVCIAQDQLASLKIVVTGVPPPTAAVVKDGENSLITNPSYSNVPDIAPWPRDSAGNVETGSGKLLILVGKDGLPKSISIEKSSGYSQLDKLEVWAAQHWAFVAAMKNNVKVDGYVSVPFDFNARFAGPHKPLSSVSTVPSNVVNSAYHVDVTASKLPSPAVPSALEVRSAKNRPASLKLDAGGMPSSSARIFLNGETYLSRIPNPSYSNVPDIAPWPRDSAGNVETGSGKLLILVGKDGLPKSISIEKSSGYSQLDKLEVWAAHHWAFVPALKNNINVDGYVRIPFDFTDSYKPLSTEPAVPSQIANTSYSPAAANETPNPNVASSKRGSAVGHAVLKVAGWLGTASLYFLEGMAEGASQQPTVGRGAARYIVPTSGNVAIAFWTGREAQVTTVTYKAAWNCEYNYNGQTFWRIFENTCPSSVTVQ